MTTNALREFRKNSINSNSSISNQTNNIKKSELINNNNSSSFISMMTNNNKNGKDDSGLFLSPNPVLNSGKKSTLASTTTTSTSDILLNKNENPLTKESKTSKTTKQKDCRQKLKEFNDTLSCYLCSGYLINATTIDICGHLYCRSCIVKYLEKIKYCPQCGTNGDEIKISNLKTDEIVKSIVYKLIPNLHQNEFERNLQFNNENNLSKTHELIEMENDDYFSPVEPISLSLEYHPVDLEHFDRNLHEIPPIRYLQCPGAVKIYHLKTFICRKFDIDPENERVDIELIYNYNQQSINKDNEEILPEDFSLMDIGYYFKWKREAPMKFLYRILVHNLCNIECSDNVNNKVIVINNEATKIKTVRFKDDCDQKINEERKTNDDDLAIKLKYKKNEKSKITSNKSSMKVPSLKTKNLEKNSLQNKNEYLITSNNSTLLSSGKNDFKILRSNDVKSSDTHLNSTKTSKKSKGFNSVEVNQKTVSKCDIVVSIPQLHLHRSSNSSDDSYENLSLAQLKTANKKSSLSPGEHSSEESIKIKLEIPKIKIDIQKVKNATSKLNKSSEESRKNNTKQRKFSIEEPQPSTNDVDLTTYAKVIGLKPIKPIVDEKRDLTVKMCSPNASPASGTSSGSNSTLGSTENVTPSSSHKKRKKGKHSKDQKDGKRRKLHAEISSPLEEGLKLKVKLTEKNKSHKSDKKSLSEENVVSSSCSVTNGVEKINGTKTVFDTEHTKNKINNIEAAKVTDIQNLEKILGEESSNISNLIKCKSVSPKPATPKSSSPQQSLHTIPNKLPVTIATSNSGPKFISTTSMTVVASAANITTVSNKTSSKPIVSQSLIPKTIASILSPKISQSQGGDRLPPSLFKTPPMTLQTISTTTVKSSIPQQSFPLQIKQGANTIHKMAQQFNRINKLNTSKTTAANFIVPNPPRGIASSANAKPFPINSIASAAHRQAAQLKRSASLDSSPNTIAKQVKMEQDRFIQKSGYAGYFQTQIKNNNPKPNFPTSIASLTNKKVAASNVNAKTNLLEQKKFYKSSMAAAYTRENFVQKQAPVSIPVSVNIPKTTETFSAGGIITHPSGLTITPQLPTDPSPLQFPYLQTNKPALEIVRISSNIPPIDQQQLIVTNNNTIKQSAGPKTTRPPPPPIPLVKIKRSQSQNFSQKTIASNLMTSTLVEENKLQETKSKSTENSTTVEVLDLSGKSSRSPSREKSPTEINAENIAVNFNAEKLEPAVSNSKQQRNQALNSQNINFASISNNNNNNNECTNNNTIQNNNAKLQTDKTKNNALLNLQLLSESATNRKKIDIANKISRPLPTLPKLNEINKIRGNATVRPQNASIRNIPNPSALAFRSHQPMPMLASITKTTSSQKVTVTDSLPVTKQAELPKSQATTTTDSSKLLASKKNLHLEQLAATLNQRAAAAADNSNKTTKSSTTPAVTASEIITVSSSTTSANSSEDKNPPSSPSPVSSTTTTYSSALLAVTSTTSSAAINATTV